MAPWRTITVALKANVAGYTGGLAQASAATSKFSNENERNLKKAGGGWQTFSKAASFGLAAVGVALGLSISQAISWESAFAGVRKTVDGTDKELRQLEEELRHGAERDALTGLWNSSRLDVELGLRAQEARRYGVGASLLSIDLDRFAVVDETLGRTRGDAFLRTVANAIRSSVRDCDHCARADGDAFVVLLPHTPADGATIVAERIGEALRACDAPGLPPGFLRASIGVAELVPGMTAERWMRHAEEARRAAKRDGGGRSVLAGGPSGADLADGAAAPA